jgi:ADP-ribose pyrophosphatase YjhB (NUDIX family)
MALADAGAGGWELPRIPASAGALLFDERGQLLILNPTYKRHWTIPGGQVEAGGETPWEACRRETREECGLEVEHGRLLCVDYLRPNERREGGMRFLFGCGTVGEAQIAGIVLQREEIAEYRLVDLAAAERLLSGPVRRRVLASVGRAHCVYLEDGRPVPGVSA